MLQRIKSKKGFTLAELLIVVAIIAVLTAIAVPLFVTSLRKAEEATFNANKDVVRTAGLVAILNGQTSAGGVEEKPGEFDLSSLGKNDVFVVEGKFDANGKFQEGDLKVTYYKGTEEGPNEKAPKTDSPFSDWKKGEQNTIKVLITVADVTGTKITLDK